MPGRDSSSDNPTRRDDNRSRLAFRYRHASLRTVRLDADGEPLGNRDEERSRTGAEPDAEDRYRCGEEVARGGMGKILRVYDRDFDRFLAMKVQLGEEPTPADDEATERFVREARVTGQLDHPGVVPVHELGEDQDGRLFFTMRMVRGKDLEEVFRLTRTGEKDWSQTRVLGIVERICETLAYAHSTGVIHRDLKPANIMVGPFGETYVMDWGLAKLLDDETPGPGQDASTEQDSPPGQDADVVHDSKAVQDDGAGQGTVVAQDTPDPRRKLPSGGSGLYPKLTRDGVVMGTLAYMPPEQASRGATAADARSDVYAIGAMLYELLSGFMPYADLQASSPLDFVRHMREAPPEPLRNINPTAPDELVSICEKAMARSPAERYASAQELGGDVRAYLENRVVKAHRTGPWIEIRKWVRRNRSLAMALCGAAVIFVLGLCGIILLQKHWAGVMAWESYVSDIRAADASLQDNDVREARRRLEPSSTLDTHGGWELEHLRLKCDGARAILSGHSDEVLCGRFSPDGRYVLSGGLDGTVRWWDVASRKPLRVFEELPGNVLSLAFSPDGTRFALGSSTGTLQVRSLATGDLIYAHQGHAGAVRSVDFDPTGKYLASGGDRIVRLHDAATGKPLHELAAFDEAVHSVAFSPDGRRLACGGRNARRSGERALQLWDLQSIRLLHSSSEHADGVLSVAFAPDGRTLATGSLDGTARLWDATTLDLERTLRGHGQRVFSVAFSADSARVVSSSGDNTVRLWDARDGEPLSTLRGHEEEVVQVDYGSGDDVVSVSRDMSVRLWSLDGLSHVKVLHDAASAISSLAVHPDGQHIVVSASSEHGARVLDSSGAVVKELPGHEDAVLAVAVSADGRRVVTGSADTSVRVWDFESGEVARTLREPEAAVLSVALSPDGRRVASGSGTRLAVGGRPQERAVDSAIFVWDLSSKGAGRRLYPSPGGHEKAVLSLAFFPDGKRLASGSRDRTVRIWDVESGEELHVLRGHEKGGISVAVSPAGDRVLSGSRDKTLRLWDARSGELVTQMHGHKTGVLCVGFSPDGSRVLSGSWDRTVRVWDTHRGELLTTLRGHEARVTTVGFSPDGTRIVSGGGDGNVRLWSGGAR